MAENKITVGHPAMEQHSIAQKRLELLVNSPYVGDAVDISSTGVTQVVEISPGTIVHKVGLLCSGVTFSGADIDVGDGTTSDKYLDGITGMTQYDIIMGGLGGAVGADPVGGAYYPTGGAIQIDVNTDTTGEVRALVWMTSLT